MPTRLDIAVLTHPLTGPTGRALAAAIGCPAASRFERLGSPATVIRWGSRRPVPAGVRVLNRSAAIAAASDKLAAFERMSAAGVPVPAFGSALDAAGWLDAGAIVLGRTRRQSRGRGIVIYRPGDVLDTGHELYTRVIPAVRDEYRLHVAGGEVIRVQRKRGEGDGLIRSHAAGYRYVGLTSRRLHRSRLDAAVAAVAAVGLDFGAVDMLVDLDGREHVLEVNTAPSCSPLTCSVYAAALAALAAEHPDGGSR